MRSVVRALAVVPAALLAGSGLLLSFPSVRAAADGLRSPQSARTVAAAASPLAISITGMSPQSVTQDSTVTVTGTLANHTGAPVSGINVLAQTSPVNFGGRSDMSTFTRSGRYPAALETVGTETTGTVGNGTTIHWSVSFKAAGLYDMFGVFPVQVEAVTSDLAHTAAARTFLVYWTAGHRPQPEPLRVAWVWPLVDKPQQGACGATLATNELAGSVAAGGRLSTLLDTGASGAQAGDLTWEIDPALLSDVAVMKGSYHTGGNAVCSGRASQPPSPAAAGWLTRLSSATAGQPAFLTPYADADAASLSHAGLDKNLTSAYRLGERVAGQSLPLTFGSTGKGTAAGTVLRAAWPADGQADAGVLTSLASDGGVSTVILGSDEQPPATEFDNAAGGKAVTGIGTPMSVLLADSGITSLLGTASASATQAGQFAFTQDFLAQTAMIVSEAPALGRSLVVAPPASWDPSQSEAAALLRITRKAPWLKPAGLSALAAKSARVKAAPVREKQVSPHELSGSYLHRLKDVDGSLTLFTKLLFQPSGQLLSSLQEAVAATESSAWRDAGHSGARAMARLSAYLSDSEHKVSIISGRKVLLAGTSGETPLSVRNELGFPVQVRVKATTPAGSQLQLGTPVTPLKVPAGQTNTLRMPVHSGVIGTTTVQLQLVTQDGSPLTWTTESLSVEVTRVGRSLLIIIGGALGILVLTSAYRLRRKRLARTRQRGTAQDSADAGGAG